MKTISYGISYERMYTYSVLGMAICRINTWVFLNVMFQETHVSRVTMVNGWASIFAMISLQDFRCSQGNLHTHSFIKAHQHSENQPSDIQTWEAIRGYLLKHTHTTKHCSPQEVFAWKLPNKWQTANGIIFCRWKILWHEDGIWTPQIIRKFLTNSICLNDNMTTKPQPAQWNIKNPCLTNYTVFKGNTGHFTSLWFTQIHKLTKAVKQPINTQPCFLLLHTSSAGD